MQKRFVVIGIIIFVLIIFAYWHKSTKNAQDGKSLIESSDSAGDMSNQIVLSSPQPNDTVTNPFTVSGKVRGTWFFEASFPAKVLDESGNMIGQTPIMAKGEWMTEDFVEFSGKIPFTETDSKAGTLVLQKDNPSGLPENDAELRIPIQFRN